MGWRNFIDRVLRAVVKAQRGRILVRIRYRVELLSWNCLPILFAAIGERDSLGPLTFFGLGDQLFLLATRSLD